MNIPMDRVKGAAATAAPLPNTRDIRLVECFVLSHIGGLLLCALCHKGTASGALTALGLGLLILTAVFLLCRYSKKRMLACLLGGMAAMGIWNSHTFFYAKPLMALEGRTVQINGVITDCTPYDGGAVRYSVRFWVEGMPASAYWYAANADAETVPEIGDRVRGNAVLAANDSQYAAARNVFLVLKNADLQKGEPSPLYCVKRWVRQYRDACAARIRQHMPREHAALMLGMLFGDERDLSSDTATALYRTGIGHVLAVSGLHLVFFCTALTYVLRKLRLNIRWILCGNVAAMLLFVIMVDAAVSVTRAAVMLLLSLAAPVFGRRKDAGRSLCIAMLLCTLPAPYVIRSASFWLSVSGVFGLTVLAPYMQRQSAHKAAKDSFWRKWWQKLSPMVWVWIAVLPGAVLLCGETSLLSVISNLVLLPLCTVILGLGLLSVLLGGAGVILLPVANGLCSVVLALADVLAKLPYSSVSVVHESTRLLLLLAVILLMLLRLAHYADPKRIQIGMLCAGGVLLLQMSVVRLRENRDLMVAVLGEARSPAIVCIANDTVVLIDQGGDSEYAVQAAEFLEARGRSRITALILQDLHNAAAYTDALQGLRVEAVYLREDAGLRKDMLLCGCEPMVYGEDILTCTTAALSVTVQQEDSVLQWKDMAIPLLHEDAQWTDTGSVVIRFGDAISITAADVEETLYPDDLLLRFDTAGSWKAECLAP